MRLLYSTRLIFKTKSQTAGRFYSSLKSPQHGVSLPFQDDLEGDPKYGELNTMYSDMFTQPDVPLKGSVKSGVRDFSSSLESSDDYDIDAINKEIHEFFEPPIENIDTASLSKNIINADQLEALAKKDGKFIIRSLSNNPYYNLALEDYIFETTPRPDDSNKAPYINQRLIFYINSKCCVIGKNQNPWKELYLENLRKQNIPFLRRRSGGGCVVHDLGNVNYSFLTSRNAFDKTFFNELIVEALKCNDKEGKTTDLKLNERGDITLNGYKISGSAFKIAKSKSYHHGTMLVSSDLLQFKNLLKPDFVPGESWDCNSVESVRSHICNLSDYNVMSQIDDFVKLITKSFQAYFSDNATEEPQVYYCDESTTLNTKIKETMEHLQSSDWKYNSTPKFKVTYNNEEWYEVAKGVVKDSSDVTNIGREFTELE